MRELLYKDIIEKAKEYKGNWTREPYLKGE
jgi:hypothetical protein